MHVCGRTAQIAQAPSSPPACRSRGTGGSSHPERVWAQKASERGCGKGQQARSGRLPAHEDGHLQKTRSDLLSGLSLIHI
eukprot:2812731-Alexandrium_andersonii.AAC.1